MFPDTKRFPALFTKQTVGLGISFAVTFDLAHPEVAILLRWAMMFWAPVPEASI
jgi:hypothetical protein